jgi:peptide/nickel transport system permease protein
MLRFVLKRLASMVAVLFAVSVLTFLLFNVIPNGDPAQRMAGRSATPAQVEAIRRDWGFDQPLLEQYAIAMRKVVTGDLVSYSTQQNVLTEIAAGLPATLSLAAGAGVLMVVFGVGVGLVGAVRRGRLADRALTGFALVGISMPVFWVAALASYFLGFKLGLFPNGGYVGLTEDPLRWAYHLLLPWTVLALLSVGFYSRLVRANVLDTLDEDYVAAARARGLSERRVLVRHVLRNSLVPVVALFGLDFGALVAGGAILTEAVFDLQGIGQYAQEAVGRLDVPPVLAVTLFGTFAIVALNALSDIATAALDPRVRLT